MKNDVDDDDANYDVVTDEENVTMGVFVVTKTNLIIPVNTLMNINCPTRQSEQSE